MTWYTKYCTTHAKKVPFDTSIQ